MNKRSEEQLKTVELKTESEDHQRVGVIQCKVKNLCQNGFLQKVMTTNNFNTR